MNIRLAPFALLLCLALAACGSPRPLPADGSAPLIAFTSALTTTTDTYTLTATVTDASAITGIDVQLNGGPVVPVTITSATTVELEVQLSGLVTGLNHIRVTASDARKNLGTAELFVGRVAPDSAPLVVITSGATSSSATYALTGFAFDDAAVTSLSYTLREAAPVAMTVAANASFNASLALAPGANAIVVTAIDAASNVTTAAITVDYQAAPGSLGVSPAVAMPGDVVTITGSNFGSNPTVTFNDVTATLVTATASTIQAVVPANAWGYPEIAVRAPFGTSTANDDLFVGLEVGTDDCTTVVVQSALDSLPEGGAVRIGACTYDGGSLAIDNRSVYGSGEDSVLATESDDLDVFVRGDNLVVVQDLTIIGDSVELYSGRLNNLAAAKVSTANVTAKTRKTGGSPALTRVPDASDASLEPLAFPTAGLPNVLDLAPFVPAMPRYRLELRDDRPTLRSGGAPFAPQAVTPAGTIRFVRVNLEEYTSGNGDFQNDAYNSAFELIESSVTLHSFDTGWVTLHRFVDSTIDTVYFELRSDGGGGIHIERSTITSDERLRARTDYGGDITILDSTLVSLDGDIDIEADTGRDVHVARSTFEAPNGSLYVEAQHGDLTIEDSRFEAEYISIEADDAGDLVVSNSTLRSTADDLYLESGRGRVTVSHSSVEALGPWSTLYIQSDYNVVTIADNDLLYGEYRVEIYGDGSTPFGDVSAGTDDVRVHGNARIAANDYVYIYSYAGDVDIHGNGTIESGGDFYVYAYYGDIRITNNVALGAKGYFSVYTDNGTSDANNEIVFSNNTVTMDIGEEYGGLEVATRYGDLTVLENKITVTGDDPYVAFNAELSDASTGIRVAGNDVRVFDPSGVNNGRITLVADNFGTGNVDYLVSSNHFYTNLGLEKESVVILSGANEGTVSLLDNMLELPALETKLQGANVVVEGNEFVADVISSLWIHDADGAVVQGNRYTGEAEGGVFGASFIGNRGGTTSVRNNRFNVASFAYLVSYEGSLDAYDNFFETATKQSVFAQMDGVALAASSAASQPADLTFRSNEVKGGGVHVFPTAESLFDEELVTISDNTVTLSADTQSPYGLRFSARTKTEVRGNIFVGADVDAYAIEIYAHDESFMDGGANAVHVEDNVFTGFGRAVLAVDRSEDDGTAFGMDVTIIGNDFDFPIDGPAKAGMLKGIANAIDARSNRWGANTSPLIVLDYVYLDDDTIARGGEMLIDPIRIP